MLLFEGGFFFSELERREKKSAMQVKGNQAGVKKEEGRAEPSQGRAAGQRTGSLEKMKACEKSRARGQVQHAVGRCGKSLRIRE